MRVFVNGHMSGMVRKYKIMGLILMRNSYSAINLILMWLDKFSIWRIEKRCIRESKPIIGVFLSLCMVFSACGYRAVSHNRLSSSVKSIVVIPFENQTTFFEVEQILTQALQRAFVERSEYSVVNDPSKADAVLKGTVSRMSADPVLFGRDIFGSTFLVTLGASIELRERETGKILFENDQYIFREQYVINADIENFFSELNPALRRIAGDFASSVAITIVENF